jgi:hypothetical protein
MSTWWLAELLLITHAQELCCNVVPRTSMSLSYSAASNTRVVIKFPCLTVSPAAWQAEHDISSPSLPSSAISRILARTQYTTTLPLAKIAACNLCSCVTPRPPPCCRRIKSDPPTASSHKATILHATTYGEASALDHVKPTTIAMVDMSGS